MRTISPRRAATATLTLLAAATLAASIVTPPASAHESHDHAPGASATTLTPGQRQALLVATERFVDPAAAVAAGYVPSEVCVAVPGGPGMGYHYVNPAYVADGVVAPTRPDMLVYVPDGQGGRTLGAVEWMGVDPDQDLATSDGRPKLFGRIPFDGPMPGHEPGMPAHFDLHVWLYKDNPSGMFSAFNPTVSCP